MSHLAADEKGIKELFVGKCWNYLADYLLSEKRTKIEKAEVVRKLFKLKVGTDRASITVRKDGEEFKQNYDIKHNRNAYPEMKEWRRQVFTRDNYTCQRCKKYSGVINAHHIKRWVDEPALRFELDNGITLCKKCHKIVHRNHIGF